MRIKIQHKDNKESFGKLIGLTYDDKGKCMAVVRLNGRGMLLDLYHPSVVTPVDTPAPQRKVLSFLGVDKEEKDIPLAPDSDKQLIIDVLKERA